MGEASVGLAKRRPLRRGRRALVALLLLGVACAWAARRGLDAAHTEVLRAHVAACSEAGNAMSTDWRVLPSADRRTVCRALLDLPGLAWPATLEDEAVVVPLVWVVNRDPDGIRRARAARVLGELAVWTPRPVGGVSPPATIGLVADTLVLAADRDPEARVRLAAAAACVRLRPLGRAYQLEQP